jgi:hypothetical protein
VILVPQNGQGSLWILKFGTVKFGKLWGEMDEVIIYFIDQAAI